mmetsp:Transcript_32837/g.50165  ORF Transcript_32837/g.50165 Transcript_32837/m.50165 type:complete len:213 (+) Transcript_32837:1653-2291(+)
MGNVALALTVLLPRGCLQQLRFRYRTAQSLRQHTALLSVLFKLLSNPALFDVVLNIFDFGLEPGHLLDKLVRSLGQPLVLLGAALEVLSVGRDLLAHLVRRSSNLLLRARDGQGQLLLQFDVYLVRERPHVLRDGLHLEHIQLLLDLGHEAVTEAALGFTRGLVAFFHLWLRRSSHCVLDLLFEIADLSVDLSEGLDVELELVSLLVLLAAE